MAKRRNAGRPSGALFAESQKHMFEKSAEERQEESNSTPVECLGMKFPNDEARRQHFLDKLREKLKDPEFRKVEGFPFGTDEDILSISDPPYYTACPNPFIADFIRCYGKPYDPSVAYTREPFAVDVSEGKTDSIYKAHSYHTKVPHLAIVPSILHYTEPGDVVLDGFCGSGMTGVAAQWCGSAPESYRRELEAAWQGSGLAAPRWGARHAVLNDLAPAATFIAANYTLPFDVPAFAEAGKQMLRGVEDELGWMYETRHTDGKTKGRIEFTVWSEVFSCPDCAGEIVFLEEALDEVSKRVKDTFPCPQCGSELNKDKLERVFESRMDPALGVTWKRVKFRPSVISYLVNGRRHEKRPDKNDLRLLDQIMQMALPPEVPINRFPIEEMYHGSRIKPKGFTHIHHFFLPRAAHALAALWRKTNAHTDPRLRHMMLFFVEQAIWGLSLLNRYGPLHFSQVNRYLTGVYYVASQHAECSPWYILQGKLDRLVKAFRENDANHSSTLTTTGTMAQLAVPDNSVDYVFTDPPFGENIYYADLNFLVESWHRVITNAKPEAIVDRFKKKGLPEYQRLMQQCFEEYCRVLKPGRWMTVVFHNSRNAVWNAIQEAMLAAGFVVADVRTLDKQQGSYRQVTSTAVKQDLVISAYKPNGGLEARFKLEAGTEEGVWDFVRTHLKQLPRFVAKDGRAEVIAERQSYLLFDRMVAFHVQHGVTVPLSAAEFYQGLAQRFSDRDGMYFLPDQAAEYDKKRMTVKEVLQLQFYVTDESSAIQWLNQQVTAKPQTFQELHPQFLKEISGWEKYEKPLELSELLAQNFLCHDGKDDVPNQIHSYLSSNFKDLRKLRKDDPALRAKAKDRWYVPDPNKAIDLEKLRERALLREFWEYLPPGYEPIKAGSFEGFLPGLVPKPGPIPAGKKIKVLRLEAVRAGFKHCWQTRDYRTIIAVAQRIPESVLQEDPKLLMWYDQALTRTGD
jgi:DNA modification methylase